MEFRAGQERGFARIWGHVEVMFAEHPASHTRVEHALLSPEDAVAWLANVVDMQSAGSTASGRVDAYLRPPGRPNLPPEVAVDVDVPEVSGTDAEGRGLLTTLLWRYTRAPSLHVRFWYTRQDPRTGRTRRIAAPRPLAHLLLDEPTRAAPGPVREVRELGNGMWLRRPGRTQCGATAAIDSAHGTLTGAQTAIRDGRADLCALCFAPP